MQTIDRYAYNNRIRFVNPAVKAMLAGMTILLILLLDRPLVSLVALLYMFGVTIWIAGIPLRMMGRLLLAEGVFLALTVIGVAISVSLSQPDKSLTWAWQVGPIWFSTSLSGLTQAGTLVLRALAGVSAMNFLALTTPLVDLIDLLRRWQIPDLLLDLMMILYRFIFVLFETFNRIYTAQESRLGYRNRRTTMRSASLLGSQLFIDAFHRSRRLQIALDSRGYDGILKVLPTRYVPDRRWTWLISALILSLILARLAS